MAMGKAQIVSNSIGLRDYVCDGENCLVAPCHDADTLRETIDRLLRDEDLRNRLGKNARSYAQTHFSQKQFAQRLADRIGKLLRQ
jgi:glycosyltransferase involved in cell wall biosynthesis